MAATHDAKKLADAMRKTLNLPHTAFPMRANAAVREPQLHARCVTAVYQQQRAQRPEAERFVLHDGPPFANGSLHMGHFLNKVLKDIINRYKLMRGFRIDYIPGWDCHGLPIEIKALEKLKNEQGVTPDALTPSEVRRLSRELARGAIADQKQDYERWGILADWAWTGQEQGKDSAMARRYWTMDPGYEARQYDVLKKMVTDGLVFRGFKPVYWSPSSQTALAESELEYTDDHVSQAAYVAFPFQAAASEATQALLAPFKDSLSCVIWTTTPWTIPSNMALCVHGNLEYVVVAHATTGRHYLIAAELVENLRQALALSDNNKEEEADGTDADALRVVARMKGDALAGSVFRHPLADRSSVVLLGDHVTVDAGTGIVHTAPGHGEEDYFAWLQYHQRASPRVDDSSSTAEMEILCPVDDQGRFTNDAGPELAGLSVLDEGTQAVLAQLTRSGHLLRVDRHLHRYPYDWRTRQPVIVRATAQWFAKLTTLHEVGQRVLKEQVEMVPPSSRRRLEATLSSRTEWCISRQRAWGLPIPVFYHRDSQEPLMTAETIAHVQEMVRTYRAEGGREGADCWWDLSVKELLPPRYAEVADQYVKGMDTLDVWFDSGSSWHTVLKGQEEVDQRDGDGQGPMGLTTPTQADVYLEGSDQHRGWFQSSLLTSVAMQGVAPFKHLITHGFALDEHGRKMSKSLGNTLVPRDFINGGRLQLAGNTTSKNKKNKKKKSKSEQADSQHESDPEAPPPGKMVNVPAYGADVLRFWVATTDYTGDVQIGPGIVAQVSDSLRKVRNTARFLLGNLNDFQPEHHAVPVHEMRSLDRYMLHMLRQMGEQVTMGYDSFAFNRVQASLAHFLSTDLSAFYMEACKDRLYCDGADSASRRAAQTVLWLTLQTVARALAPVVCHTAEDIRLHLLAQTQQCALEDVAGSIFTEDTRWLPSAEEWRDDALARQWGAVRQLRVDVNRVVEAMRGAGVVGSQLECNVTLVTRGDQRVAALLASVAGAGEEEEEEEEATLANVLLCSGVDVVPSLEETATETESFRGECRLVLEDAEGQDPRDVVVEIVVTPARGHKCPRCWKYAPEVDAAETLLCLRCARATQLQSVADLAAALVQE